MTDLYSKASLILTSNAFSQSKAYAVKPATGTGDFTFSRNSASGSRIKSDGSIEFVNSNVPRLNYLTTSSSPSFLLEPQRTNLLSYSNTFNDTSWYRPQGFISASIVNSPEGILNGWKLNEMTAAPLFNSFSASVVADGGTVQASTCIQNSIGALLGNVYSITKNGNFGVFTNGTRYICSAYVKPAERTAIAIETNLNGTDYTKFDLTGTGSVVSTQAGVTGSITPQYNGWFRISAAGTMADSTRSGSFSLTILSGSNYSASYYTSGSETNGLYIYGAQIEAMPYTASVTASSYIPTTTVSATSNKDLLFQTGLQAAGFCTGVWTVFVDYDVNASTAPVNQGATFLYTQASDGISLWYLVKTRTGVRGWDPYVGNQSAVFNEVTSPNASKIAISSDGTTMSVYLNGTLVGTYAPISTSTLSIDKIYFDANESGLLYNPTQTTSIKNFIIYPTALSAVECLTLTQLTT